MTFRLIECAVKVVIVAAFTLVVFACGNVFRYLNFNLATSCFWCQERAKNLLFTYVFGSGWWLVCAKRHIFMMCCVTIGFLGKLRGWARSWLLISAVLWVFWVRHWLKLFVHFNKQPEYVLGHSITNVTVLPCNSFCTNTASMDRGIIVLWKLLNWNLWIFFDFCLSFDFTCFGWNLDTLKRLCSSELIKQHCRFRRITKDSLFDKDIFSNLVHVFVHTTHIRPYNRFYRLTLRFLKKIWSQSVNHDFKM